MHAELTARVRRVLSQGRIEAHPVGDLRLWLLNADFGAGPLSREDHRAAMETPPFWAICWPAGRVLAERIGADPSLVAGKRVLDLGCGGGVAGLAAARMGGRVRAVDLDPDALLATAENARLNGLKLGDYDGECELTLLADVLYDRANWGLLEGLGPALLADCRVEEPPPGFHVWGQVESAPLPDLPGWCDFNRVWLYRNF